MSYRPSPAEAKKFDEDGYLIINEQIFAPDKFAGLREICDLEYAQAAQQFGAEPQLIDCPHWSNPKMFKWLLSDEMLALVEPLIGPDIAIFACHFLRKPASVGKRVPWHEDSAYWKGRLDPLVVASVTIALEPATAENGCLQVIPGTHKFGYSTYAAVDNPGDQVFPIEILPEDMDVSKAVNIEIAPGEASIHDGRIIHGSAPNTGTVGRSALTVRYFPTSVKFVEAANPDFHIYLAHGKDQAGNRYDDPTKAYPPAPAG